MQFSTVMVAPSVSMPSSSPRAKTQPVIVMIWPGLLVVQIDAVAVIVAVHVHDPCVREQQRGAVDFRSHACPLKEAVDEREAGAAAGLRDLAGSAEARRAAHRFGVVGDVAVLKANRGIARDESRAQLSVCPSPVARPARVMLVQR